MASNLERDIHNKTLIIKKGIKDLRTILGQIYDSARRSNNKKLIFIKRDVDNLEAAFKCLSNLDFENPKETKTSSFEKEALDLHRDAINCISKLQKLYKNQEESEKKDLQYNGKFFSNQKNLDNLRLAYSRIREMSIGQRLSKQDWNEIEKK